MPCYEPSEGDFQRIKAEEYKRLLDERTAMFCNLLTDLETASKEGIPWKLVDLPASTRMWWHQHKEWDIQRKAFEKRAKAEKAAAQKEKALKAEERKQLRKSAKAKLSPEEYKAVRGVY